ncbi:MAG TPA: hypothetical protein VLJ38_10070, partial [Polyangiaceae bacterium]|nr:hypothetical protein [Polyangiaceae bacterium]
MTRAGERSPEHEPPRLAAGDEGDPVFDELGRWFAAAPAPRGIDATALARVAQRLDGVGRRRRVTSLRALAAAFALVTVATGSAAMWQRLGPSSHAGSPSSGVRAAAPPRQERIAPHHRRAASPADTNAELPATGPVAAPSAFVSPSQSAARAPSPVALRADRSP